MKMLATQHRTLKRKAGVLTGDKKPTDVPSQLCGGFVRPRHFRGWWDCEGVQSGEPIPLASNFKFLSHLAHTAEI